MRGREKTKKLINDKPVCVFPYSPPPRLASILRTLRIQIARPAELFTRALTPPPPPLHPPHGQLRQYSKVQSSLPSPFKGRRDELYIRRGTQLSRRHVANFPSDMCVLYAAHTPCSCQMSNGYNIYIHSHTWTHTNLTILTRF